MIDDRDEYNKYGTTYWGAPVTGSLLFCVITIAMGILFDFLYEKTNSMLIAKGNTVKYMSVEII